MLSKELKRCNTHIFMLSSKRMVTLLNMLLFLIKNYRKTFVIEQQSTALFTDTKLNYF